MQVPPGCRIGDIGAAYGPGAPESGRRSSMDLRPSACRARPARRSAALTTPCTSFNMPPCSISLRPRLTSAGPNSHLTSCSDWTPLHPGSPPGGTPSNGTLTCVSLVLSLIEMWRSTIVAERPFAPANVIALLMHACRRSTARARVELCGRCERCRLRVLRL